MCSYSNIYKLRKVMRVSGTHFGTYAEHGRLPYGKCQYKKKFSSPLLD